MDDGLEVGSFYSQGTMDLLDTARMQSSFVDCVGNHFAKRSRVKVGVSLCELQGTRTLFCVSQYRSRLGEGRIKNLKEESGMFTREIWVAVRTSGSTNRLRNGGLDAI